jgi:hypothetical protein
MKSGDGARLQGPLKKAASRLPPFTHQVISTVLEELGVASHCAEGEGDSPTAELAQRRNGFVVSNDSDYFIFNSNCRGYVPLHSIGYGSTNDPRLERVSINDNDDEPPRMQFLVYDHRNLAKSLNLPPCHLPILAALIGNDLVDYSSEICLPNRKRQYYPGRVEPQEIVRIAKALSNFSSLPATTLAQIQDVIFSVLPILLARPSRDPEIITKLATSAYSYRLLPLSIPTLSFPLNPRLAPSSSDTQSQAISRQMYLKAYKSSRLSSFIVHVLKHQTVCLQGPLEIPEFQSPVIYLGRPLRRMIYSILDHVVGIDSQTGSIIEYCRKGEEMLPTSVPIHNFMDYYHLPSPSSSLILLDSNNVPLLCTPPEQRFQLFLYLLKLPQTLNPSPMFPIIASLNHIILHCPISRIWSTYELLCATLTASILLNNHYHSSSSPTTMTNYQQHFPPPKPREPPNKFHLHLTSELLTSLVWIDTLGGSLLLDSNWKGVNWKCFDGKLFHGFLGLGLVNPRSSKGSGSKKPAGGGGRGRGRGEGEEEEEEKIWDFVSKGMGKQGNQVRGQVEEVMNYLKSVLSIRMKKEEEEEVEQ